MIAYVESNFVLEVIRTQEEADAAEKMLELCERGTLELALPVFALIEPSWTIGQRQDERSELRQRFMKVLREVARTPAREELAGLGRKVVDELLYTADQEATSLRKLTCRLIALRTVHLLATDAKMLEQASIYIDMHTLKLFDAVMYATCVGHMRERDPKERKVFLERDTDFASSTVQQELERLGCRLIPSFRDGLAHLTSSQSPDPAG